MRRFFVRKEFIDKNTIVISGSDVNHIKNVLRMRPGDAIEIVADNDLVFQAVISRFQQNAVLATITGGPYPVSRASVRITVAQAILKGKKLDDLIRPLSELGVDKLIPFYAKRSIPKPNPKTTQSKLKRWQKIAIESVKQCRRGHCMTIHEPVTFDQVLLALNQANGLKFTFWENALNPMKKTSEFHRTDSVCLLLGPEGGLTRDEIDSLEACGFQTVSLGPRILRAETATIAACTLVQFIFGDMG